MLGTRNHEVVLCDYDPGWARAFAQVVPEIQTLMSGVAQKIEHVGSTALGIAAKPMVDIAVGVHRLSDLDQLNIKALAQSGYFVLKEQHLPGELTLARFTDHPPTLKTHVLHAVELDSLRWRQLVVFRDHLRSDPKKRDAYAALKQSLSEQFPKDIMGYTEGKSAFVDQIINSD